MPNLLEVIVLRLYSVTISATVKANSDSLIRMTPSRGGHAVVAVGYDDNRKIGKDKGAVKIRNSWGTNWGAGGYGWLPYSYIEAGLAEDFWSLFKGEYIDTGKFE
jgi:C1A family cysteine protease